MQKYHYFYLASTTSRNHQKEEGSSFCEQMQTLSVTLRSKLPVSTCQLAGKMSKCLSCLVGWLVANWLVWGGGGAMQKGGVTSAQKDVWEGGFGQPPNFHSDTTAKEGLAHQFSMLLYYVVFIHCNLLRSIVQP